MTSPLVPLAAAEHRVYVVAGGNHVTVLLRRDETEGALDVIEVLAQPGGGPPPHSHAFGEWFRVLDGELTLCEDRGGTVVCTARWGGETPSGCRPGPCTERSTSRGSRRAFRSSASGAQ
jgi:hypothetical protein